MRLIHCADLHLDSKMTASLDREKAKERKKELLLTFERMVAYARENQVEAILIAGDLFDTKNISATARQCVGDVIRQNPEIMFFYLKGNHDTDHFLNGFAQIPANLLLFGEEWTAYAMGNVIITGLELTAENSGSAYNSLVLDMEKFNIVMLHGQDVETSGKEDGQMIRLRELKNKGIDYLALGHIHAFKGAPLDSRGVYCYSGCLEGRGFDECGQHGFVLLDVDEESGRFSRQFIPFAYRQLHEIQVDVTDCEHTMEMMDRIMPALEGIEEKDMVKVVLTGAVDVACEVDITYIQTKLASSFYFAKVYDETTLYVDIKQFMRDESLKGEFVRTVMAATDLSEEGKAEVIRYGLRAIAGEEVIECD